jgi:hypothetical protein
MAFIWWIKHPISPASHSRHYLPSLGHQAGGDTHRTPVSERQPAKQSRADSDLGGVSVEVGT